MKILVLNAGSSSQKSCLYDLTHNSLPTHPPIPIWEAHLDWTKQPGMAELKIQTFQGATHQQTLNSTSRSQDTLRLLETLWSGETQVIQSPREIDVVGHRVVHGGQAYRQSVWIDDSVKAAIAELSVFAPVHNPANLEGIVAIENGIGAVRQVAVFDTAFHTHLPLAAAVYPIPYSFFEQGIRRYGFHGISHQYCRDRAAQLLGIDVKELRLITCHLGNGCSLAAIRDGQSVDTTMGFTPLEGLMMGSRSGSIDPGIVLQMIRQFGYTADQVDEVLNHKSGLLGVSGVSSDMRQALAAESEGNERAKLAIAIYVHRLRSAIGAMLPSLGSLQALVFTAGVGENSPRIRALVCEAFEFLGLKLDPLKNQITCVDQDISTADSTVKVFVIHTQEDWAIAQECWRLLKG